MLARPLLEAIRRTEPTVLLVDETDKADVEVEGLLLEVLSDFQVTIPELGTVAAQRRPFVVLTSNATRELTEALKRRCLYLHLDYPEADRERAIVLERVPEIGEQLAEQLVRTVRALRAMELKKAPSIAESIDWARTLVTLGLDTLDAEAVRTTLGVVKAQSMPLVLLTSNNSRELTEALTRRCLYLWLDYPSIEREVEIVRLHAPDLDADLARRLVEVIGMVRELDLKKPPSIAESIDWARALLLLGADQIDAETFNRTMSIIVKHRTDLDLVAERVGMRLPAARGSDGPAAATTG